MGRTSLVFLFLFTFIVVLAVAVSTAAVVPFDTAFNARVRRESTPVLTTFMRLISVPGESVWTWVLIGITTAVLTYRRYPSEAAFLLVNTLGAGTLGSVIKLLLAKARPSAYVSPSSDPFWTFAAHYSFPSGHVIFYVAFFGGIAYLAWTRLEGLAQAAFLIPCVAMIILVGPSRIFLGAHWLSDVLGGYSVGLLWMLAVIGLFNRYHPL